MAENLSMAERLERLKKAGLIPDSNGQDWFVDQFGILFTPIRTGYNTSSEVGDVDAELGGYSQRDRD